MGIEILRIGIDRRHIQNINRHYAKNDPSVTLTGFLLHNLCFLPYELEFQNFIFRASVSELWFQSFGFITLVSELSFQHFVFRTLVSEL